METIYETTMSPHSQVEIALNYLKELFAISEDEKSEEIQKAQEISSQLKKKIEEDTLQLNQLSKNKKQIQKNITKKSKLNQELVEADVSQFELNINAIEYFKEIEKQFVGLEHFNTEESEVIFTVEQYKAFQNEFKLC